MLKAKPLAIAVVVLLAGAGGAFLWGHRAPPSSANVSAPAQKADAGPILMDFKDILANYRKTIVLLADEDKLSEAEKREANRVGQEIFHENQERIAKLNDSLEKLVASNAPDRLETLGGVLDYVEMDASLFDADRLAFRELLQSLLSDVQKDMSLPGVKMHKRISEDLDALNEIEHNYEKELGQIFDRFAQRSIEIKRERWEDYIAHLKGIYTREQILKDHGVVMPYPADKQPAQPAAAKADEEEVFGTKLPKKTVVLTFDDGPHKLYTNEIAAILKQYGAPAVFFNVGRNLGSVDASGKPKLSANAEISRKLEAAGYVIGNHSFTHAQLSKETGDTLKAEIMNTDLLLKAIDPNRPPLFRFPYGARNKEGMQILEKEHLKSVMWNIDSLDWADPLPASIADRVLRSVDKDGRGIILFHDIHERTVKALPLVLDRLVAEGYQFAGWDGSGFTVGKNAAASAPVLPASAGYNNSWAIVIGINDYAKWPKLQYAVQDSQGVRQILIDKFGFSADRVISLQNGEATRTGILAAFHDRLAHDGVQKNDRIFVFFAGHGATRKLSSGRDLGYIIPADSDPNEFASDAIPMTEIQNIAESLTAKHVFFVMDACYSGLGLTRGGGSGAFMRDNSKRIAREMLTAGGADQMVADGGPNGHSVFTWALLQGLGGKADLNGDGLITATELAAYVAPAVSSVSDQTPAFGSLPGSEGGDFVFELPSENEFISTATAQLPGDVIALNKKLDAPQPVAPEPSPDSKPAPAPVVMVKDLQGNEQKIVAPNAVPVTSRQQAQIANDRGLQLYREKQYAAAEAQFTEALKLRPDFALAANNLGFVYFKQEKYKEAAVWFQNAIRMDPSRAIAYLNLADAQARSGDAENAKKSYQTYLELAPNSASSGYVKQQIEKL